MSRHGVWGTKGLTPVQVGGKGHTNTHTDRNGEKSVIIKKEGIKSRLKFKNLLKNVKT